MSERPRFVGSSPGHAGHVGTVANFRRAMAEAGNQHHVVRVYPDANHSLLVSADGSPSTGGTETTFTKDHWTMQVVWLTRYVTGFR